MRRRLGGPYSAKQDQDHDVKNDKSLHIKKRIKKWEEKDFRKKLVQKIIEWVYMRISYLFNMRHPIRLIYNKNNLLTCGILLITGFSIIMISLMSYSFIYLQRDQSTCIIPAMSPSYTQLIGFDKKYTKHANKYNLYLYHERNPADLHNLQGIPVLFIPGNAGSYKQVRSIASEAAHQFSILQLDPILRKRYTKNLDFFSGL
ncbi:hypothetical protein PCK1_001318 [Pneumocystis canis]|nr:hypothetical protein PCK1_001318 [Pneumocystis canis]